MDLGTLAYMQATTLKRYILNSSRSEKECIELWNKHNIDKFIRDNFEYCYLNRGFAGSGLLEIVEKKIEQEERRMNLTIYHGSRERILRPTLKHKSTDKEYGQGLYTTSEKELAKQWAMASNPINRSGYIHKYRINTEGLKVLYVHEEYGLFDLVSIIAKNKEYLRNMISTRDIALTIIEEFYDKSFEDYDIVVGHRFDGRYMHYIEKILKGELNIDMAEKELFNMFNNNENLVIVIKSQKALSRLEEVYMDKESREPEEYISDKRYLDDYMNKWDSVAEELNRLEQSKDNQLIGNIFRYARPPKKVYVS